MRRSEINQIIRETRAFFVRCRFALPPFAAWSLADWRRNATRARWIVQRRLGWDVTDFGSGRFEHIGLVLFTLRNGLPRGLYDVAMPTGYAEKALVLQVGQKTPVHYHIRKTEDIVNRAGGTLCVQVFRAGEEAASDGEVRYLSDGLECVAAPGDVLRLHPGESISLTPEISHAFWATTAPVLAGEISTVNDDESDNRFLDGGANRFPRIDEDEPIAYPLVSDYHGRLG